MWVTRWNFKFNCMTEYEQAILVLWWEWDLMRVFFKILTCLNNFCSCVPIMPSTSREAAPLTNSFSTSSNWCPRTQPIQARRQRRGRPKPSSQRAWIWLLTVSNIYTPTVTRESLTHSITKISALVHKWMCSPVTVSKPLFPQYLPSVNSVAIEKQGLGLFITGKSAPLPLHPALCLPRYTDIVSPKPVCVSISHFPHPYRNLGL